MSADQVERHTQRGKKRKAGGEAPTAAALAWENVPTSSTFVAAAVQSLIVSSEFRAYFENSYDSKLDTFNGERPTMFGGRFASAKEHDPTELIGELLAALEALHSGMRMELVCEVVCSDCGLCAAHAERQSVLRLKASQLSVNKDLGTFFSWSAAEESQAQYLTCGHGCSGAKHRVRWRVREYGKICVIRLNERGSKGSGQVRGVDGDKLSNDIDMTLFAETERSKRVQYSRRAVILQQGRVATSFVACVKVKRDGPWLAVHTACGRNGKQSLSVCRIGSDAVMGEPYALLYVRKGSE